MFLFYRKNLIDIPFYLSNDEDTSSKTNFGDKEIKCVFKIITVLNLCGYNTIKNCLEEDVLQA